MKIFYVFFTDIFFIHTEFTSHIVSFYVSSLLASCAHDTLAVHMSIVLAIEADDVVGGYFFWYLVAFFKFLPCLYDYLMANLLFEVLLTLVGS